VVSDPKPATKDSSKIAATDCLSKTSRQKLIFVCGCAIICSGTAFFSTQSIQGIVESLDKGLDGHNPAQKIYDRALAPSYVEQAIWLSASLSFLALLCLGYGLQKQSESRTRGLTKLLLNLKDRSQLASVGNDDNCKSPETNDKNFSDKCGSDKALAEAFNSLATSLKDLDSGHRQWVADTSHELRTPIAVLGGLR
jgi:signal transduction histidine kinase